MQEAQELLSVSLHELTVRVQEAPSPEEKLSAFGDWLLKVVGIDGVHGADAVNEVLHAEFGPQMSLTPLRLRQSQRYYGSQYILKRNGELHKLTT